MGTMSEFLDVAVDAAKSAGTLIKKGFNKPMTVTEKSPKEFVSEYDLASEKLIIEKIRQHYPEHGIYSEEAGDESTESDFLWVLDPLDGTHNFIYGLPYYGVSIGLLEKGKPIVGVIYLPETDELVYATKNQGAYINDEKIRVSKRPFDKAAVFFQSSYPYSDKKPYELIQEVTNHIQSMRIYGVAVESIKYVAKGCADAYVMHHVRPHDVAAGTLIIEEAGGRVSDFGAKPWRMDSKNWLASNGVIHDELLEVLA